MVDLDVHQVGIVARDKEAFALWMAGAEAPLRASLRRFAAYVDTESTLQETLLRVWLIAHRVEADGQANALLRLAFRIARNHAISELRRSRTGSTSIDALEEIADPRALAPELPDPALRRTIQGCQAALPEKPALALRLRLETRGGEPDASLAERAGMRLNTFLQNVTRAKKLLAECLAARGIAVGPR